MSKLIDVNGLLYLWQKIKTALSAKADKTELHSHANKTELDKIREGEVESWRDMVVTGIPEFPNQATLDSLGNIGGKLSFNGQVVDTDTKYDLTSYAKTSALADYAKTTDLAPYAKTADLTVYAKTADVYNKTQVYAKTEVYSKGETYSKTELDGKISSAMRYRGTVLNYAALPTTEREIGDTYNITEASANNKAGDNAVWAGDHWDILSGVIDTTSFLTEEDIATTSELSAILT